MKALVGKVVSRGQSEATRAPTVSMLLQPRTSRNFSREVEEWLVTHDVALMLEGLVSHLLRTLPHDEIEETDKWLDGQKVSNIATTAIVQQDVVVREIVQQSPFQLLLNGQWSDQSVCCVVVKKVVPGLTGAPLRSHQHRLACMTATGPQLSTVMHENVLPTFGFWVNDDSVAFVHQRVEWNGSLWHSLRQRTNHLTGRDVLTLAKDVLAGLGHMHTLGFLHRNLTVEGVFQLSNRYLVGGLDFCVRSSRGRVSSPAWAPRVPAPETVQTRTFEISSDIFAFGVFLLEVANYGEAVSLPLPLERPSHIPEAVWRLIVPCLSLSRDARPTCGELTAILHTLENGSEHAIIPFPSERHGSITTELLSGLHMISSSGKSVVLAESVEFENVSATHWGIARLALQANENMKEIALSHCTISGPVMPWKPLTGACPLEKLDFRGVVHEEATNCQLLNEGIRPLLCSSLHELRIADFPLAEDITISFLQKLGTCCPSLRSLSLEHIQLTSEALRMLGEVLSNDALPGLAALSLGGGDALTSHGIGYLCTAIQRRTLPHTLRLDGAILDYFAVGNLGQLLRQTRSLRCLSLHETNLSECSRRILENGKRGSLATSLEVIY